MLSLGGPIGYNNGVYLLNDFCNTLYGNEALGATARSINVEDVEKKINLEVWDYRKFHDWDYYEGPEDEDDEENRYYPFMWKQENTKGNKIDGSLTNGKLRSSEQSELSLQARGKATRVLEVNTTTWSNKLEEDIFIQEETRDVGVQKSVYYELFKTSDVSGFWFATRGVGIGTSYDCAFYGLVSSDFVGIHLENLYDSEDDSTLRSAHIRPIVKLNADIIDLDTGYDDNTGWRLKCILKKD